MGFVGRGEGVAALAIAALRGAGPRQSGSLGLARCARSSSTTRAAGELSPLRPRDPGRVGVYACGPTVYSRIHIGNARPFVVFVLLKRFLEHEGYVVDLVVNVTDVNDKIYDAARTARALRARSSPREMTARYRADTDGSGWGAPTTSRLRRDDRADHRLHPGADRPRARLRGRRGRLFPGALRPRLRHALTPPTRQHGPG